MSLEQKIETLTAAVEALTKAMQAGGNAGAGDSSSGSKTTKTTKTTKTDKPAHTVEEAQAALLKLKDEFSIDKAKEVLASLKIAKMADIKAEQADAVFAAAEAKYAELKDEDGGSDDGL